MSLISGLKTGAVSAISKVKFKAIENTPEILLGVGIISFIGTVVYASKATLKADDILEEHKKSMDTIHEAVESAEENPHLEYSPQDVKKDTVTVYIRTAGKMAKAYAPAIALGSLSLFCFINAHNIQKNRYLATAAAYNALDAAFKAYRQNVKEEYGEEADTLMRYSKKEKVVSEEDGKEVVTEKRVPELSMYARIFDESNPNWVDDAGQNLYFLRRQQGWLNDKLQAEGYLFLNDVYNELGFPITKAGQYVGWLKNGNGDGYVDFIRQEQLSRAKIDFINGYEKAIVLDFNVDGMIINTVDLETV